MGRAGRLRAERHYRQAEIMGKYRAFYTDHSWAADPPEPTANPAPHAS
jgi:hypothetical protein